MPFDDDLMDALQPIMPAGAGGAMVIPTVGGARSASDPSLLLQPGGNGWSEVSNYTPSWTERVGAGVQSGMEGLGFSRPIAQQYGSGAEAVAGAVPGVGTALSLNDLARAADNGDLKGMGMAALGAIPGIGAEEAAASAIGKKARQEAITAVSLRQMPLDEAIESAQSGRHIIPKDGGFVGAPYNARTMDDVQMIRNKFDADVAAGAAGADWYPRAQEWIKSVAGDDPVRQSEMARALALFSAQADPKSNLGFAIKAHNNAIMGMTPVSEDGVEGVVRTGQQWRTYKSAFDDRAAYNEIMSRPNMGHNGGPPLLDPPEDIRLGLKTGIYADHMDPTRTSPTTGTNDIWHARALGYTTADGKPWESALTAQQHAWMDAETVLAVDRANKAGIGGRTDWTPGEIQAAPWVAGKGRGLEEKRHMTPEEGLAEASKTYPDYAPSFTAYGTHEMVPGKSTGHLPDVANGSQQVRDDYSNLPGGWWKGSDGRDILYDAQGAWVGPTADTVGIFDNEFNLGQAATPMVTHYGPSGARMVEPGSRQMMDGTEAFRAYMDAQDGGAWSHVIPGQKMGHSNGFELPGGAQTREDVGSIIANAINTPMMPDVLNQGGGRNILTNFDNERPLGISPAEKKAVQKAFPGAQPIHRDGNYLDYRYNGKWEAGEGSDAATNHMLSQLRPEQEAAFSRPEVKAAVLAKFDRDAAVAASTGQPVRQDIQYARHIFAGGGIPALRAALGKGLLPAAAVGAFLPYALSGAGGSKAREGDAT